MRFAPKRVARILALRIADFALLCLALTLLSPLPSSPCAKLARHHDIAVVLGAQSPGEPQLSAATSARVDVTIALYRHGLVRALHMSGAPTGDTRSALLMAARCGHHHRGPLPFHPPERTVFAPDPPGNRTF